MARRIWIIAKKPEIEQSDIDDATLNGCPEIANGIPPVLGEILSNKKLPCVYEEPALPSTPARDLAAEVTALQLKITDYENLKARVTSLEQTVKTP